MPRIDPEQLLTCLQVLLSPSGGILSKNEVQRLANLMTKFSKKLVSKCIYVLILKNTDRPLLGAFMAEGGWNLIHIWLQDANTNRNWPLVTEILELLLISPVDVERLKMNNLPKLIKSLTKRDDLPGIQQLATSLVEDWLTIVKGVTKQEQEQQQQQQALLVVQQQQYQTPPAPASIYVDVGGTVVECIDEGEPMEIDESIRNDGNIIVSENGVDTALRLKIIREGKKVISRVIASTNLIGGESNGDAGGRPTAEPAAANNGTQSKTEESEETDKENSDKKQAVPKKSSSSSSSSSSKSSNSSSSSRDKDKDKDRSKDRSKSSSSSSSSRSKSSSRDKDRDRRDRDRDKHRHNGSSSSSSSSKHKSSSHKSSSSSSKDRSKDPKEKQAEKDKDTLAKIQPQTLQKLGRIPKKSEDTKKEDKKDSKKSSFSVEVRKSTEEKPKTVKVYNSKMRSTGLLEEAKPPPPRSATKKTAPAPALPASIPTKRPSPIRDTIPPPEKKSRLIDTAEKGGIKLVPPKPKHRLRTPHSFSQARRLLQTIFPFCVYYVCALFLSIR